jgi:N-methylhydantoinase A/oxoprolinase/acetone carboxylase beta subunit
VRSADADLVFQWQYLEPMRLGVDVGGTFTDAVLVSDDGRLCSAKSLTTPGDQSEGVLAAPRAPSRARSVISPMA